MLVKFPHFDVLKTNKVFFTYFGVIKYYWRSLMDVKKALKFLTLEFWCFWVLTLNFDESTNFYNQLGNPESWLKTSIAEAELQRKSTSVRTKRSCLKEDIAPGQASLVAVRTWLLKSLWQLQSTWLLQSS